MAEAAIWNETFRVRSYETDPTGRATVETICNYLQECAGNHAFRLGFSVEQLFEQNLTWFLARLRVKMNALPAWRDDVIVETWPSGVEGLIATRDFEMRDGVGRNLGRATSGWMMIDLERRRPVRMPKAITSLERPNRDRALTELASKLPDAAAFEDREAMRVRYGDLDVNGHVNNVRYVAWAIDALGADLLASHDLDELEVLFRAEAVYDDPLQVRVGSLDAGSFSHVILQTDDGKELARLRTSWTPR